MLRPVLLACCLAALLLTLAANPARAQLAGLADDLVILTNRLRAKENARTHIHLGPGPGSAESALGPIPGAPAPPSGEPPSANTPGPAQILPPARIAPTPAPTPIYAALDLPATTDEGPPDGLTLDAAIDRLLQCNYDLRTRFQELSKAQADIVTAGLRNNPFLFGNVGSIPYTPYGAQRPGGVNYEVTVIQSWDVNQKRRSRILVARSARTVLEALYQDAVRREIDNLYTAFIDVLAAREAVRQQQAGLAGLEAAVRYTRQLVEEAKQLPPSELDRVIVQRDSAALAVDEAVVALRRARQALAVMLGIQPCDADRLEVRGTITGPEVQFPCLDELIRAAVAVRPDLEAYRLGIDRARAEVKMARADRWADVFVLYTPWTLQENAGAQSATSWSLGALVTLPVFNRNQGNIARARTTVTQVMIETEGRERQIVAEVRGAYQEFAMTSDAVGRYRDGILPRARRIRDDKLNLLRRGQASPLEFLAAQKEYNDVVRLYLEASVRHRRSALRLNTAVGQRVVP